MSHTWDSTTREELAGLDDRVLCRGWRACARAVALVSVADLREMMAGVRALYLDEFERRNPLGFARWLTADPFATDPEPFIFRESSTS